MDHDGKLGVVAAVGSMSGSLVLYFIVQVGLYVLANGESIDLYSFKMTSLLNYYLLSPTINLIPLILNIVQLSIFPNYKKIIAIK